MLKEKQKLNWGSLHCNHMLCSFVSSNVAGTLCKILHLKIEVIALLTITEEPALR